MNSLCVCFFVQEEVLKSEITFKKKFCVGKGYGAKRSSPYASRRLQLSWFIQKKTEKSCAGELETEIQLNLMLVSTRVKLEKVFFFALQNKLEIFIYEFSRLFQRKFKSTQMVLKPP